MRPPTFFLLVLQPPPRSTLFPYTTLFRSHAASKSYGAPSRRASASQAACSVATAAWRAGSVPIDRKSTRLNSSHVEISYAVFCLKKKKMDGRRRPDQDVVVPDEHVQQLLR